MIGKKIRNNKTFCTAPWMHLHIINDGRAYPCCNTDVSDENSVGNIKNQSIFEVMNSPKMKDMRRGMVNNEPLPSSCERCTGREAAGFVSMRKGMNDDWYSKVEDLVNKTNPDGSIGELRLLYWDIRFSNYCNLSCRTCSPIFSTSWAKDYVRLRAHNDKLEIGLINLNDQPQFWDDLDKNISVAEEIHFAGGEPLLMPEHWKLIKFLEDNNRYETKLKYSTNATKLEIKGKNILEVWEKFKNVHLSLSIDGEGDVFELTRHGGNWEETKENLIKIRNSNIEYWIHPTISILNIFNITELHRELFKLDIIPNKILPSENESGYGTDDYFIKRFHLNPCLQPDIYSITNIPEDLKKLATDKINAYANECYTKHNIPKSGWNSLIEIMNSKVCDMNVFRKFVDTTKKLDKIRNQCFVNTVPEFKNAFDNV